MTDNHNNNPDDYTDYLNELMEDDSIGNDYTHNVSHKPAPRKTTVHRTPTQNYRNQNIRRRKGLKWTLIRFFSKKSTKFAMVVALVFVVILIITSFSKCNNQPVPTPAKVATTAPTTQVTSHKITGVPVIAQGDLHAACETYACTMLLQSYDFDIDEFEFVDNYLVTKPVYYGIDGNLYGPDMNSAYAGDIYTGYGINAPGMAKCMNNYLKTAKSKLTAQPLIGVSMEELCKKYILNDIPVMVWATTYMDEPYIMQTWIVDYVDENATNKIGDTVSWQMHEHCMVLIGFDAQNYYFCDSVSGKVSAYDRATSEERYSQIGMQAIVLK